MQPTHRITTASSTDARAAEERRRPNRALIVLVLVAALAAIGAVVWRQTRLVLPDGISRSDYDVARRLFRQRYGRPPDRVDAYSLLGEQCVATGRLEQAAACFDQIPADHPRYGASARLQAGQVLMRLNRAVEAEDAFRTFLAEVDAGADVRPEHLRTTYQWLVYLLSVEQRLEDRKQILAEMHERQLAGVWESKLFYFPYQLLWNSVDGHERLLLFLEQDPGNPMLRLAHGLYLIAAGDLDAARSVLVELQAEEADNARIIAAILAYHFEQADWEALSLAAQSLPPFAVREPWQLTRMRGELALHEQRWDAAATQFERVLAADPANPWSHMGLARAHGRLGHRQQQDEMLHRAQVLADIRVNMYNVSEKDSAGCRALAEKCDKLEMPQAARTFRQHAERIERASAGSLQTDRHRAASTVQSPDESR